MAHVIPNLPTQVVKFSYRDYLLLPDDGKRYEIIEGEMYMTPSPNLRHQDVLRELFKRIEDFVSKNLLGIVYVAPCDVVFSNANVVQPDLIFIAKDNRKIIKKQNIAGAPDLLVEITSPATRKRDLIFKKRLYAKFGVKEYWIVFPDEEKIEVNFLSGNKFELFSEWDKYEVLRSKLLKGLEIELAQIFRDSEDYF